MNHQWSRIVPIYKTVLQKPNASYSSFLGRKHCYSSWDTEIEKTNFQKFYTLQICEYHSNHNCFKFLPCKHTRTRLLYHKLFSHAIPSQQPIKHNLVSIATCIAHDNRICFWQTWVCKMSRHNGISKDYARCTFRSFSFDSFFAAWSALIALRMYRTCWKRGRHAGLCLDGSCRGGLCTQFFCETQCFLR